ncbi:DotD/TraH family lipoprotein [Ensifer aridi]|uniref:DotD/TraH family lipoprotein n=1 Tax=Ensifer aridi TaxID=1708715 RepID=UPI000A0F5550|nr:DotD/TraH family lipoprotein [Ensifer aridi]
MRYSLVVALAFLTSACANKAENFDTLSVRKYVDSSLEDVNKEKRYASLYPRAVERFSRNTVKLHPEVASEELLQPVDARWNGTLDDITRKAARMAGYSVRADGERSGSPIMVSVHWADMTLISLLREAFGQGKGRAWLEVDQVRRVMTIHYARPEKSPVPHLDDTTL